MRANLTRVTSPPNSNTGGSRLIFYVPFSYFLFIVYLPRFTSPDLLLFLPWLPCHFYRVIIEQQQQQHTTDCICKYWLCLQFDCILLVRLIRHFLPVKRIFCAYIHIDLIKCLFVVFQQISIVYHDSFERINLHLKYFDPFLCGIQRWESINETKNLETQKLLGIDVNIGHIYQYPLNIVRNNCIQTHHSI